MKPQELRIGNYVLLPNGSVHMLERSDFQHNPGLTNLEDFRPVPVTKKWLTRFGWKYYNGKISGDLTMDTPCKLDIDFVGGVLVVKSHYQGPEFYKELNIPYVHQLQNLFYSLGVKLILNYPPALNCQ